MPKLGATGGKWWPASDTGGLAVHIILGAIALLGAVLIWYYRYRMARDAGEELLDVGRDVRAAARRFMYKRKHNMHPADAVDDPRLAAAGIAMAVATMDAPISQAELDAMNKAARETFDVTTEEAEDITHFGRWVADQCQTNGEAVRRLSKVIKRVSGAQAEPDLIKMVQQVATADGGSIGDMETEALDLIRRTLGTA